MMSEEMDDNSVEAQYIFRVLYYSIVLHVLLLLCCYDTSVSLLPEGGAPRSVTVLLTLYIYAVDMQH